MYRDAIILPLWPVNPSYCHDRLSLRAGGFLLLKEANNMEERTMSLPVINLARTGNNIKRIAKENGFSADKIKDYLGICDKSNVYKWFRGDALPSVDNLLALSILFGVTINEMIIVENTEKAA